MTTAKIDSLDTSKIIRVLRLQGAHNGQHYALERIELDNGCVAERNFILTSNGWQETIFQNEKKFEISLDLSIQFENQLVVKNSDTKEVVSRLDRIEPFTLGSLNLVIKAEDKSKWEKEEERLKSLDPTEDDFKYLLSKIRSKSNTSLEIITDVIDQLHDEKISKIKKRFFKGIHYENEYGVSRFVTDRVYHLPKLLEKLTLNRTGTNSYTLNAQENTSAGVVGLEHSFEASSDQEAQKITEIFKRKITGIGERLWLSCWDIANEAASWLFEVDTYDLYCKCHPERTSYPGGNDRIEFFSLIRLLERTKLFFTRKNKGKKIPTTYELPIIQILSFDGTLNSNGWPRRLKIQVIPPNTLEDKMAFVAVPFHRNTLRLGHNDTHLATMLQTRRSQCKGANSITFTLEDLIKGAGLLITAQAKLAQAKKLLIAKLERVKMMGIIKSYPSKLPSCLQDHVNIRFPSRGVT